MQVECCINGVPMNSIPKEERDEMLKAMLRKGVKAIGMVHASDKELESTESSATQ